MLMELLKNSNLSCFLSQALSLDEAISHLGCDLSGTKARKIGLGSPWFTPPSAFAVPSPSKLEDL